MGCHGFLLTFYSSCVYVSFFLSFFFSPPLLLIVGCCRVFFFLLLSSASVIRLIERSHNGVRVGGFEAVVGVRLYLLFITEINFYCRLCMCLCECVCVRVFV